MFIVFDVLSSFVSYLIVFTIRVASTVLTEYTTLAVEHKALVTLAPLNTVLVTVSLSTCRGTLRLAHHHTAGIVAVHRARQDWAHIEFIGWVSFSRSKEEDVLHFTLKGLYKCVAFTGL